MLPQVLTGDFTFVSLGAPDLSKCGKKDIQNYFTNAYDINESLFSCLSNEEAFYKCPDNLRLPLIFYYGHTAAVYVNKMILANIIQPEERVNFSLETIFETGVDEMSWDDTENYRMGNKYIWPSIVKVTQFRKKVKELMLKIIDRLPLKLPITFESPWWTVMMGIEHERIHIETSSVLIRQMPIDFVKSPKDWKLAPNGVARVANELVKICGSTITLGKSIDCPLFGWDNEYGHAKIRVPDFEASQFLITNEEFVEFVLDGGYKQKQFWSTEGWSWMTFQEANHPTFWVCNKDCKSRCGADLRQYSHCKPTVNGDIDSYRLRCIFDIIEMPTNWPVEVNYYEAKAFCAWKGKEFRLLAEAEHTLLRQQNYPESPSNIQFLYGSSTPVDMFPPNKIGIYDASGNVWCWLEDHFNGFSDFQTHYLYDDFTTPCFDGLHTLIAGGSWATNGVHVEKYSRFSFRRHFFQNLGFRIVKQNLEKLTELPIRLVKATSFSIKSNYPFVDEAFNKLCIQEDSSNLQFLIETPELLERTLSDDENGLIDFVLEKCLEVIDRHNVSRDTLLHIGCGAGGLVFGMKKYFKKVAGIDLFQSNIDVCTKLANEIKDKHWSKNELKFKQVTWIPNELAHQNVVIFSMAERVMNLKAWSSRMPEVVGKGGILFSFGRVGKGHVFDDDEVSMNKFILIADTSFEFENDCIRFTAWRK